MTGVTDLFFEIITNCEDKYSCKLFPKKPSPPVISILFIELSNYNSGHIFCIGEVSILPALFTELLTLGSVLC